MAKRIQRTRVKGSRLADASSNPNGYRCVTRGTAFGNPFKVGMSPLDLPFVVVKRMRGELGSTLTGEQAVEAFEIWLEHHYDGRRMAERARIELRDKDLACWCPVDRSPCHADILLRLAAES